MRTLRASPQSGRPSTTSRSISSPADERPPFAELIELIDSLPDERIERVFTHTSWAPSREDSYERLEFLGDSVLGLAIARELYERFPDYPEGQLAKIRAHVVSRQSCAVVGRRLDLGGKLAERAGDAVPPEELERLAVNRNVLAALVEAALGAIYLEHGFEVVRPAVLAAFADRIDYALTTYVDYKTELQEELARRNLSVTYQVLEVEGPPHDRRFTCAAVIEGEQSGVGRGASKKAAEQNAAREALASIAAAA
jgi:ribonuclease-3